MIELKNPAYVRRSPLSASALIELGIEGDTYFARFLARYDGPLSSCNTSLLLLNVDDPNPNQSMLASTRTVRKRFAWPQHFVVLTDIVAMGVFAYDTCTEFVYATDFEGGDARMISGKSQPRFESMESFLQWFLEGEF